MVKNMKKLNKILYVAKEIKKSCTYKFMLYVCAYWKFFNNLDKVYAQCMIKCSIDQLTEKFLTFNFFYINFIG